ncbi:hypothetical protein NBRC116494_10290 [Aurantivibrio plasticivorans]
MSDDAIDNTETADPVATLRKSLGRWRIVSFVCAFLGVVTSVGAVATVWYTGSNSLTAFKDLPVYQVNTLTIDYREAVMRLDESIESTKNTLANPNTQYVLFDARQLVAQVQEVEAQFADDLSQYSDSVAIIARDVGGALEWNRHFQRQVARLVERSRVRQASLNAIFDRYPRPDLPELDPSDASAADSPAAAAPRRSQAK